MNKLVTHSQKVCRKTIVHKMWEDPTWPVPMPTDEMISGIKYDAEELESNDDLKASVGYILAIHGIPDFLRVYD
jgi:hypothetical protein